MSTHILQPGEIEASATTIPTLRLPPAAGLFAARAARLRRLAEGHTLGDWLRYAARLVDLQDAQLQHLPTVPGADAALLARSREHILPPLAPLGWRRDPAWRGALRGLADGLSDAGPPQARAIARRLAGADDAWLEGQANLFLAGATAGLDIAAATLIGAALQVYWLKLASGIDAAELGGLDVANLCPVCGSRPVASIIRIGGAESGLRYLHCSLCETEWHMVRVKCSQCESTKGIAYHHVDGAAVAVRAESCDECRTYLKIVNMEKDPDVDPFADDLASLALDVLMDEAGYTRSGLNPLLIPGES